MNSWAVPLVGIKSADQTISSQTSFVNDADLRVALAATATYEYRAYLRYDSPRRWRLQNLHVRPRRGEHVL